MFNSVSGTITAKHPSAIYLENNGIEWDFQVSSAALDRLGPVGSTARIYSWLYHREDQMRLFGFYSVEERNLFLDLLKVDGIGPKQAVKILSSIPCAELEAALEAEDLSRLESAPGIGKKTAQKMILALKGKLTRIDSSPGKRGKDTQTPFDDIVNALSDMGFDRKLALEAVESSAASLGVKISASGVSVGHEKEQELFRQALVALSS